MQAGITMQGRTLNPRGSPHGVPGLSARLILCLAALIPGGCHVAAGPAVEVKGLIGASAPGFALQDGGPNGGTGLVSLSSLVSRGPVVVVFHRGLHCPICVEYLASIGRAMGDFRKAGVEVVAIGPDTPEETRIAAESFDPMPFPLLCDPGDAVARSYQLERPDGSFCHGSFAIGADGIVRWGAASDHPVGSPAMLRRAAVQADGPS